VKIKSIKKIDYKEDVYNLHIKDNHNYFASNHCVSNCHEFDDVMSDFVSIKITEGVVKKLKFTNETDILKKLKKVSTITQYITFLEYLQGEVISTIGDIDKSMQGGRSPKQDKRDLRISKITGVGGNSDVKIMQVINDLKQYQLKIDLFLKEYKANPHNWVLETYFNEKHDQKELSLEPIWAYDYLDKYVWSKYDMVILMSGTILDKRLFVDLNGLDLDKTVYYSVPSPFPVENRPIYYMPLGKMSYAKKEDTFKNYVSYLHKILKKYDGKKGIIHTNSFELSNWIQRSVDNPRLVFHESSNKDEMLRKHFETEEPTVFVSPSVGTGVSFDHDRSRFQIIAKIPYPSLGSQKNKMRQKNNPEWYAWKTVCGLLQMTGRSVRSKTDFADTIIIDGSFSDILRYSSHLIPGWVQVAIKRIDVKIGA
jgi:Rad3-related DNA helicase